MLLYIGSGWERLLERKMLPQAGTKYQVMYKAHHPPPKKGLRTHKKKTQTNKPPPTPKLFFSFFCSFLLFPFFVLVFCFCVVSFFVAKKEQKTMRILFLFISTAPHSTQHTAQSTGHRAQSTHTHTHTQILHNEAIRPKLEHKVVQG